MREMENAKNKYKESNIQDLVPDKLSKGTISEVCSDYFHLLCCTSEYVHIAHLQQTSNGCKCDFEIFV